MIQILELFGGIGSPRIALRNLGIDVKAIDYVEIDEKAVRSYNAMFKKDLAYKTQSVVNYNLKPDILIHGSPCQDFSIAGHQKGADEGSETRSSLMWETINIIEQMGVWKPRIVIWENVKNLTSKHMIHNFSKYLSKMQSLGYMNSFKCLNATDYGLPQKRNRYFTISCLDGSMFNFDTLEKKKYKPLSYYLQKDVIDEKYMVNQPSILKGIGTKGINRATVIKDFAYTITTRQDRCPAQIIDIGNGKYRFLTELECWRLQGYSDSDFKAALKANPGIEGKKNTALYRQAGNSIPVCFFEAIFKQLLSA